ncbi:glycosyltransferase family 4 protein [Fusobacterium ulcerans]|uniref:glycosyltransferase family 4 protein n=1 Tax=Fusobacterium ulcerans TaxID=861 RepID=UPI00241DDAEC|nr:glycosyltransferase family 4 protein [Fusobacterium ulcerans]
MKFLFLVHRYPKNIEEILEKDMIKVFSKNGHEISVVVPNDRKNNEETYIYNDEKIKVLYVKTGNYQNNVSRLEKIISILTRDFLLKRAIKKYFKNENFDYIVGYTPFMADFNLIKKLKEYYNSKTLLMLWDIFPQNAKDLKIIKNNFVFKYFKYKEKKMYEVFDKVVCNCEGQIEYILKNNFKEKADLLLVRNSEFILNDNTEIEDFKKEKDITVIFGGNMGIPQKLENLMLMIKEIKNSNWIKFIFIGNGSEKNKLKKIKEELELENLQILDQVSRFEYEKIIKQSSVAIISLNEDYTVPNFPAKVTGYCKVGVPIFASLDKCSYEYLGKFIIENNLGVVSKAGDISDMKENFLYLVNNLEKFSKEKIKEVYKREFDINKSYETIMQEIKKD